MDLPVWQALYEELADEAFTVIAVSFDTRAPEQSRPWIESASPTYPCVLDPEHEVADLYNMINVPNRKWANASASSAVWARSRALAAASSGA